MKIRVLAVALLVVLAVQAVPAFAQIINLTRAYRIVKVDTNRNRIEVTEGDRNDSVIYVLVDGYTQVYNNSILMRWTDLQPGNQITVKGGLTLDLKMKAKTIILGAPPAVQAPQVPTAVQPPLPATR